MSGVYTLVPTVMLTRIVPSPVMWLNNNPSPTKSHRERIDRERVESAPQRRLQYLRLRFAPHRHDLLLADDAIAVPVEHVEYCIGLWMCGTVAEGRVDERLKLRQTEPRERPQQRHEDVAHREEFGAGEEGCEEHVKE